MHRRQFLLSLGLVALSPALLTVSPGETRIAARSVVRFTASGTWSKPSGAEFVLVSVRGGGGRGGVSWGG